jgi:hypothetical protein
MPCPLDQSVQLIHSVQSVHRYRRIVSALTTCTSLPPAQSMLD